MHVVCKIEPVFQLCLEPDSLERVRLQIMLPGGYLVEGISKEAARQAAAVKEEEKAEQLPDAEPVREQERAELMGALL